MTSLLLATMVLAGCTSENEPQSDDVNVGTDASTSAAPSVDPSVPDTGEEKNGTPDPTTGTPQPKANVAPVAELTSDVTEGTVPFDVVFEFAADDEDGDELSWTLDVDGDGEVETEGTSLPANFTYTFDAAGDYTALFSVSDGEETVNRTLEILALDAVAGTEILFLHGDGSMDHTTTGESEDGHGSVNLAAPLTSKTWISSDPLSGAHAAGSAVEIHIKGFTLHPHPAVDITAALTVDGAEAGSGTATEASVSIGLVTTPCTDWVVTFDSAVDIPADAELTVTASVENAAYFAPCFEGTEEGSRLILSA